MSKEVAQLHDLFYRVMSEYGAVYEEVTRNQDYTHPFGRIIRQDIPRLINAIPRLNKGIYIAKGRHGAGNWSAIPYICIFDKRLTTSAQRGAYIVYLFNKDTREMFLSFVIGAIGAAKGTDFTEANPGFLSIARTKGKKTNRKLQAVCAEIRKSIGTSKFLADGALKSGSPVYDSSCVCYKKYTLTDLPYDEELVDDLLDMIDLYQKYYDVFRGGDEAMSSILSHWPSGARDTTEFPKVSIDVDVSMRDHLKAFIQMDGVGWTDYEEMNSASGSAMTGSRLRTYRKMYEKFGLIFQRGDKMHLSRLGHQMASLESDLNEKKETVLDSLRKTAVDILSRYQLRNPADNDPLPETCDVLPSVAVWRAMICLDNKLHPEEVNRVLMHVMQMSELEEAIEKIKTARVSCKGNYDAGVDLNGILGVPVHTEQVQARIAPWFSFLGWGGLIIEQNVDAEGFRNLAPVAIPLIKDILKDPPSYYEARDEEDWLNYYIGDAMEFQGETSDESGQQAIDGLLEKRPPARSPRGEQPWPINQILFGAPGTGKTYSTAEHAIAIVEKRPVSAGSCTVDERKALMDRYHDFVDRKFITFTTFHQSYGYEDFIQGMRPDTENGSISFVKSDGAFKRAADRALEDPENNYVIIIDEINRANISKVFGELITLIEEDKRWGELNQLSVTLPMGETFVVPNNLYIIGTMNSADKSISLIDTALRRRFSFIEMPPREDLVSDLGLRRVMQTLNSYLKKEFRNTDLLIGHAYFMNKNAEHLPDIMNSSIIPLLYEYFYDDEAKVKKALECLKDTNYELDPEPLGRVHIKKKDSDD